jgi:hypothetical protein
MSRLERILVVVFAVLLVFGLVVALNLSQVPARDVVRYGPVAADSLTVGGGFGSTGCTISSAGVLQCDGAVTMGSSLTAATMAPVTLTVGGGFGDSGCTVTTGGALSCNGAAVLGSTLAVTGTTSANGGLTAKNIIATANAVTVTNNQIITPTYTFYNLSAASGVTITLGAACTDGQLLYLRGDDNQTITIADSNIYTTDGNALTLGQYDMAGWLCTGNKWLELWKSANS